MTIHQACGRTWVREEVIQLSKLWVDENLDSIECANRLSQLGFPRTSNAVLAKIARMRSEGQLVAGSTRRACAATGFHGLQIKIDGKRPAQPETLSADTVREISNDPPSHVVARSRIVQSVLDLRDRQCRWPFGDPGQENFHFCSHDQAANRSYCPQHEIERIQSTPSPGG